MLKKQDKKFYYINGATTNFQGLLILIEGFNDDGSNWFRYRKNYKFNYDDFEPTDAGFSLKYSDDINLVFNNNADIVDFCNVFIKSISLTKNIFKENNIDFYRHRYFKSNKYGCPE